MFKIIRKDKHLSELSKITSTYSKERMTQLFSVNSSPVLMRVIRCEHRCQIKTPAEKWVENIPWHIPNLGEQASSQSRQLIYIQN